MKKKKLALLMSTSTLLLSACGLPGLGQSNMGEEGITITTQTGTEMQILGYLMQGMIDHYMEIEPELILNLGTSDMQHQALISGQANVSAVRYTGTVINGDLGIDDFTTDPEEAQEWAVEGFANDFDTKWYDSYGFENTYWFLVTEEVAEEYGLEVVSDLAEVADQLQFGVDDSWMERPGDGYRPFVEEYGFEFPDSNINVMQIGLVYDGLENGFVDVALGYSTDGRISSYNLVHLEDDRQFFPPYDAAPSATFEVLEEYPELDEIITKLAGVLDTEQMQELNYLADDYLIEPAVVAEVFLEENNYFEDVEPYVEPLGNTE
jgi:osmoprotectant transport system substrate-binding protein